MTDFTAVNRAEAYRYMGIKNGIPEKEIIQLTEEIITELSNAVNPHFCVRDTFIEINESNISFGAFELESRDLSKHLSQCPEAILLAATLGSEADRIIEKYSLISPSRAVVAQGAATAMIEQYADDICKTLKAEEEKNSFYLRPRFSPGYGDLPLSAQEALLTALDARKKTGICLTDSKMMTPVKSITAIIGKTKNPQSCHINKCAECGNKFCVFRVN